MHGFQNLIVRDHGIFSFHRVARPKFQAVFRELKPAYRMRCRDLHVHGTFKHLVLAFERGSILLVYRIHRSRERALRYLIIAVGSEGEGQGAPSVISTGHLLEESRGLKDHGI